MNSKWRATQNNRERERERERERRAQLTSLQRYVFVRQSPVVLGYLCELVSQKAVEGADRRSLRRSLTPLRSATNAANNSAGTRWSVGRADRARAAAACFSALGWEGGGLGGAWWAAVGQTRVKREERLNQGGDTAILRHRSSC